jgi:PKD repeat protein
MRRLPILVLTISALSAAPALGATTTVHVGGNNFTFNQKDIIVTQGDTVHWTWEGYYNHSVTSGPVSSAPTGDGKFPDAGVHSAGFTYDQTFSTTGTYPYFCKVHYQSYGMVGSIRVLPPDTTPPNAGFAPNPTSPTAGQIVTFDGSSSSDPDTEPLTSYQWDFGDGSTQTTGTATVTHTYAMAGSYAAKLTVVDYRGNASTPVTQMITVSAPAPDATTPTAAFTASSLKPATGDQVRFDGSGSADADGDTITSYMWDFGDGSTQTSTTPTISHSYTHAGQVTVTLVVLDNHAKQSAPATMTLTVTSTSGPGSPGSPAAPSASKLHLSSSSFCAHKSRTCRHPGVRLSFTLTAADRIQLAVVRRGRMLRQLKLTGHAGKNSIAFSGAGLHPGHYTLILTPAGGHAIQLSFTVLAS